MALWQGILNASNWAINKVTKPWHAEMKSCPNVVTMGAAPSVEVEVKVEVRSLLLAKIKPEGNCNIVLELHSSTSNKSTVCDYCSGHTHDGLHCFSVSLWEPGKYSLSVKHLGETLNQRGEEVNLTVLPPPLDYVKSTYRVYTNKPILVAGQSARVMVSLLDKQGKAFIRPVELSYFIKTENQPEKCIHYSQSDKAVSELKVILLKAGETNIRVRANGQALAFSFDISADREVSYPQIRVVPNKLHKIVFEDTAYSLRGDGRITHTTNQLWLGVPYFATVRKGFDRYNNETKVITSWLTAKLHPEQPLTTEMMTDKIKLVIPKVGIFQLMLKDLEDNVIYHNLPPLKVEEPPLDCSKSTFKVHCRSQDLTAGESVKLDIDLRNVEGNGYKGLASLAVYLQGNDTVTLLDKRVSMTQSSICLSQIVKQTGNYQIVIKTNGQSLKYVGTSFPEKGHMVENKIKITPAKLHRIELEKYALSMRGDGKIKHLNNHLWVGVKFFVVIKQAFDQFDNRRQVETTLNAILNPEVSNDSLLCMNTDETLQLVINKRGLYDIVLKSEGCVIKHNLPKLRADEPPIDLSKCYFEIEVGGLFLKAGESVLFRVFLKNVEEKPYKGTIELSFYGTFEEDGADSVTESNNINSVGLGIEHSLQLCKVGRIKLFVMCGDVILKHTRTCLNHGEESKVNLVKVLPAEAKTVLFDDVSYSMGDEVEIRHPNTQLWIKRPCHMKLTKAWDLFGNRTELPNDMTAYLTPNNNGDSLEYEQEDETLEIFVHDPGKYQLGLTSTHHQLNHNIKSLNVLRPFDASLRVLANYDLRYSENVDEDCLPLVGNPFRVKVEINCDMQETLSRNVAFVRNSDGSEVDKFVYLRNTVSIRHLTIDSPGLVSDVIWLKVQDVQTDAGIQIRGLDDFDENSVEVEEYPEFERIMCYHSNFGHVFPRLICGDDNANLRNIARVTDVYIEKKNVMSHDEGVSVDIDSYENDDYEDVCDMIKLLLAGKHYRRVASYHDSKRRHFAQQTREAYDNNEFQDGTPTVLSRVKETHADIMQLANNKAMDAYFEFHNRNRPLSEIDLHDLRAYKNRAKKIPGEAVEKLVERMNNPRLLAEFEWLEIIVGAGNHSEDGRPQIRPLVEDFLQEKGYKFLIYCRGGNRYDIINGGSLLITFKKYSGPEPCFGQFYCPECDKVWWSRYSWSGYKQTCRRCGEIKSVAYKMSMDPPYFGPRKNETRMSEHNEEMCEKCQKTGKLCTILN